MTDADIAYRVSERLQEVARLVDDKLTEIVGEKLAFTLIVFTFPRASYVSNAPRDESVREIRNLLALWNHGMPDIPAHKVD